MRLGLLSTANINRQILAGAAGTSVEVVAVASRDGARQPKAGGRPCPCCASNLGAFTGREGAQGAHDTHRC